MLKENDVVLVYNQSWNEFYIGYVGMVTLDSYYVYSLNRGCKNFSNLFHKNDVKSFSHTRLDELNFLYDKNYEIPSLLEGERIISMSKNKANYFEILKQNNLF